MKQKHFYIFLRNKDDVIFKQFYVIDDPRSFQEVIHFLTSGLRSWDYGVDQVLTQMMSIVSEDRDVIAAIVTYYGDDKHRPGEMCIYSGPFLKSIPEWALADMQEMRENPKSWDDLSWEEMADAYFEVIPQNVDDDYYRNTPPPFEVLNGVDE